MMLNDETMRFRFGRDENEAKRVIQSVCSAMEEKGYNPVNQFVGYLLSADPAYITGHQGARNKIRRLERDKILEELVRAYIDNIKGANK